VTGNWYLPFLMSMGLLLLVALLVSIRAPRLGAVLLAICVAFKLYALAWFLPSESAMERHSARQELRPVDPAPGTS